MRFADLLAAASTPLGRPLDPDSANLQIAGLTADSRDVRPGFLFAAIPGTRLDGRAFIPQAVAAGAAAILAPAGTALPQGLEGKPPALVTDANPRRQLAILAAAFYAPQPRRIACVTGTSGKTSTAHFTRAIWERLGLRAASLGTLGVVPPIPDAPPALTTPDPVGLHRCLGSLQREGVEHAVLEASSHGLDQFRLDGLEVSAAAFTNLSREHLDYHGTMEAYLAAKARLFSNLLRPDGTAVLNRDVPEFEAMAGIARRRGQRILAFGKHPEADLRLQEQQPTAAGQVLTLSLNGRTETLTLPLIGDFQAWNALAALGLVLAGPVDPQAAVQALAVLPPVPGRLEASGQTPAGGRVYVDYAHKPAALEAVLATLRPHVAGKLVVVFGCGGDRDRGKRPIMGEIAARMADAAIVTDDNPRSEDPAAIRAEILAASPRLEEIGDRQEAIAAAMRRLSAGDRTMPSTTVRSRERSPRSFRELRHDADFGNALDRRGGPGRDRRRRSRRLAGQ